MRIIVSGHNGAALRGIWTCLFSPNGLKRMNSVNTLVLIAIHHAWQLVVYVLLGTVPQLVTVHKCSVVPVLHAIVTHRTATVIANRRLYLNRPYDNIRNLVLRVLWPSTPLCIPVLFNFKIFNTKGAYPTITTVAKNYNPHNRDKSLLQQSKSTDNCGNHPITT